MTSARRLSTLALLTSIAASGPALAQTFQKIVATDEVTPGVNVNFSDLRAPAIDHDELVFCGQSFVNFGRDGFYRADLLGNVSVVATEQTARPGGGGNFTDLCVDSATDVASIDGAEVAFFAFHSAGRGVYLDDGASLTTIVDDTTDFPDTDASVLYWGAPSLDGRIAVTWGNQPATPNFAGVYSFDGPTLFAVADTNAQPTTTFFHVSDGTVSGPDAGEPQTDEGAYAFAVNQSPTGPYFVYRRRYGPLEPVELIAAGGDPLPGDQFLPSPHSPQMDRSDPEQLCFLAGFLTTGVYRYDGAEIAIVADTDTAIPGGTGSFTGFGLDCAIDAGDVVFTATGTGQQWGVYLGRANGALERVADTNTALGEATASIFTTSREAISGGRIAFAASGAGENAIWVTPAPEPGATLAAACALLALAGVSRRR